MTPTESAGALAVREQQALSADISGSILTGAQLKFIANTDFVPKSMRGNVAAIAACVATGRALGLPDMTALRSISIVDGKATFAAELMVSLVRSRGHHITFKATGDSCTVYGKRADNGDTGEFTWTLEMAKTAGLLSKDNWKKYPDAMLWARAVSQLCRMLFADCFAGATYTPEELGDVEYEPFPTSGETADEQMEQAPAELGEEPAAEVVAERDEFAAADGGAGTDEQKDKMLELVGALTERRPDVDWSKTLSEKLHGYGAKSYNDLSWAQLDGLLSYLEGELPKRRSRG